MKNIYEIYDDVFNDRKKQFPMKFWNLKDSKKNGIKLLQYIIKELEMTEVEIQNLSQIDLTRTFKLGGLYKAYNYNMLSILNDAFPEIKFTKSYLRISFRTRHSEIIKNLSEEKWDKIKYGIRNNRYTPEYGKKLSDGMLGELNSASKLKAENIPIIRRMWAEGHKAIEIGERFGVKRQTINDIVFNRTWKHIK